MSGSEDKGVSASDLYRLYQLGMNEGSLMFTPFVAVAKSLEQGQVLLERVEGRIIAFLRYSIGKKEPVCRLLQLYVVPEYRRRGTGSKLLRVFESICRAKKMERIRLKTGENNGVAQKFYASYGYVRTARLERKIPEIVYEKSCTPKQRPYNKKMDIPCSTCVRDRKGCQRGWFYARNDGKWTCDHKVESGDVSLGLTPELRKKIVRKIVEEYQETRDPFLRSPKGFERFLKQRWDHYEWKECWAVVACTHCGITVRLFDTKPAVECPRCGRLIVLGDPLTETTPLGRIG